MITAIARHDTTGTIYFTTGYANAALKKVTTNGIAIDIKWYHIYSAEKPTISRKYDDLYMALGDVQSSSINVTGTPVIYHIDVSTNAISEYLTNADGTMWVTDVYAPTYAPADIYITDYASHSVLKVTKSKNVKKYVHLRKSFGAAGWLSGMAPYMIVGKCKRHIHSMNWWQT